jgi:hypothetical protein
VRRLSVSACPLPNLAPVSLSLSMMGCCCTDQLPELCNYVLSVISPPETLHKRVVRCQRVVPLWACLRSHVLDTMFNNL